MPSLRAFQPFADDICRFLGALSQVLMADQEAKPYPDVITFAFFCRKANLEKLKERYRAQGAHRLGRGVTFHIAPSNVPINFAYSLACGLLSGNACIVRAPSKPFRQTEIVCRAVHRILKDDAFRTLQAHIALVRYDRDNEITAYFSSLCDVRVIWGGDDTIRDVRRIAIPPRAFDLTFADRYSLCVIQAAAYLAKGGFARIAQDFYNDTYLYDQNACSSPRLVVWIGLRDTIREAKRTFWETVHEFVRTRYTLDPVIAVDKLATLCCCAIDRPGVIREEMPDQLIARIHLERLSADVNRYRCPGGCFLEYDDQTLDALAAIIGRKHQTLSYIGFDPNELCQWVLSRGLSGIDRIVPVGRTADFGPIWDGYDLIACMSRICDIQ
jgi:hypothetical protein